MYEIKNVCNICKTPLQTYNTLLKCKTCKNIFIKDNTRILKVTDNAIAREPIPIRGR
jgi:hypothetical protein